MDNILLYVMLMWIILIAIGTIGLWVFAIRLLKEERSIAIGMLVILVFMSILQFIIFFMLPSISICN